MTVIDQEYYARRLREERAAEKAAPTREIAQVHAELAQQYEEALRNAQSTQKP